MIRLFSLTGLLTLGLGLVFAFSGLADDPSLPAPGAGEEPQLKKLDPKQVEPGKDQAKPKKDDKKGVDPQKPTSSNGPVQPDDKTAPKIETPTKPLTGKDDAEDPKEVIARITKNMEASEENLKKSKTGTDTQAIQKKIIDDLEKLINQQQRDKADKENQKNNQSQSQSSINAPKDKNNKPEPSDAGNQQKNKPKPQQKLGDPKTQQPADVTQKPDKDNKDKTGAASPKEHKDKKDSKTTDNTVSGLVKDVWGHLPKNKRQEMDAYSHEQFMPQYEQLLRQYYQTIAAKAKNKEGE